MLQDKVWFRWLVSVMIFGFVLVCFALIDYGSDTIAEKIGQVTPFWYKTSTPIPPTPEPTPKPTTVDWDNWIGVWFEHCDKVQEWTETSDYISFTCYEEHIPHKTCRTKFDMTDPELLYVGEILQLEVRRICE